MKRYLLTAVLAVSLLTGARAQHLHTYAGDNNHDGYLDFSGPLPLINLTYQSNSVPAASGYGFSGSYTPTAQHKSDYSGQGVTDVHGALSGTYIVMTLYAVDGPAGGSFAFFEAGGTQPAFTLAVGQSGGTSSFPLTEEVYFALIPSDPYGHIHGRQFAVNLPGTYTVTWALGNTQPNGTGSSLQNPDEGLRTFTQTFVAVPEPRVAALFAAGALLLGMRCRRWFGRGIVRPRGGG